MHNSAIVNDKAKDKRITTLFLTLFADVVQKDTAEAIEIVKKALTELPLSDESRSVATQRLLNAGLFENGFAQKNPAAANTVIEATLNFLEKTLNDRKGCAETGFALLDVAKKHNLDASKIKALVEFESIRNERLARPTVDPVFSSFLESALRKCATELKPVVADLEKFMGVKAKEGMLFTEFVALCATKWGDTKQDVEERAPREEHRKIGDTMVDKMDVGGAIQQRFAKQIAERMVALCTINGKLDMTKLLKLLRYVLVRISKKDRDLGSAVLWHVFPQLPRNNATGTEWLLSIYFAFFGSEIEETNARKYLIWLVTDNAQTLLREVQQTEAKTTSASPPKMPDADPLEEVPKYEGGDPDDKKF